MLRQTEVNCLEYFSAARYADFLLLIQVENYCVLECCNASRDKKDCISKISRAGAASAAVPLALQSTRHIHIVKSCTFRILNMLHDKGAIVDFNKSRYYN